MKYFYGTLFTSYGSVMFYRTCTGLNNSQVLAELVSDLFFRRLAKKFFFADKSEKRRYIVEVKADYFFIGCKNADYAVIFFSHILCL